MAEPINVVLIDLPGDLLAALEGKKLTQRQAFDQAVESHLDRLVGELEKLRLTPPTSSHRRPRKVSQRTWERLGEAAERLDVSRPALLRACLRLLVEQGGKTRK